jgi:hypothetical protein
LHVCVCIYFCVYVCVCVCECVCVCVFDELALLAVSLRCRAHTISLHVIGLISAMAVGPNPYSIVVGTSLGFICLWDLRFRTATQIWRHSAQTKIVKLSVSPSSSLLPRRKNPQHPTQGPLVLASAQGTNELCAFDLYSSESRLVFRITDTTSSPQASSHHSAHPAKLTPASRILPNPTTAVNTLTHSIHFYLYTYKHARTHTTYSYIRTHTHTHIHTHTHTHTHTHKHTHTHTHTHTHIHAHTHSSQCCALTCTKPRVLDSTTGQWPRMYEPDPSCPLSAVCCLLSAVCLRLSKRPGLADSAVAEYTRAGSLMCAARRVCSFTSSFLIMCCIVLYSGATKCCLDPSHALCSHHMRVLSRMPRTITNLFNLPH